MATPRRIPINRNNKFFSEEDFNLEMVVYKTTNLVNGKIYVGQDSKNDPNYIGSGKIMKYAIKKYGKDNFIKEVIEYCETKEMLDEKEKYWIGYYNSTDKGIGYNITKGGEGCLGLRHSEETKQHMKIINTGKNNPMWGKVLPKESLNKRSKKVKEEGTFKDENNPNFKFKIDKDKLYNLFINQNMKIKDIANIYGCSKDVINRNLRKYDINKPKSNKYNLDINKINQLLNEGLSQVEIGKYFGCSNKIINKFIKKHKDE